MSHATDTARTVGARNRKGFTLIDLSIVLAIIALFIGGIMVGQNLIRSAELLSVTIDVKCFTQAIQLFKEKYKYLPGDMPTATNFWGTDSNCPTTSYTTTPHTATCNGDGNGRIGDYNATTYAWGTQAYEVMRVWQQLADAGFIDGSYSGVASANAVAVIGHNVPASQLPARAGRFIIMRRPPVTRHTTIPLIMATSLILETLRVPERAMLPP